MHSRKLFHWANVGQHVFYMPCTGRDIQSSLLLRLTSVIKWVWRWPWYHQSFTPADPLYNPLQTNRYTDIQTYRQIDIQTNRHTHIYRHTDMSECTTNHVERHLCCIRRGPTFWPPFFVLFGFFNLFLLLYNFLFLVTLPSFVGHLWQSPHICHMDRSGKTATGSRRITFISLSS